MLSDEDDVELSEEEFLRARLRGLQAYLNRLLSIPCVSWCKRFANFLEPDSGQMNVASEGMMTGVYGLQRSQFGLAVALLQQQYMVRAARSHTHTHRLRRCSSPSFPRWLSPLALPLSPSLSCSADQIRSPV